MAGVGAGGGGGAHGALVRATGSSNAGILAGGHGGNGGGEGYFGGGGGAGGYGLVLDGSGLSYTNNDQGEIHGGDGGSGGSGTGGGGGGGSGGIGVDFTDSGTLINSGVIAGGAGGAGGRGDGPAGAGVVGAGLSILNSGTISGGGSANALLFTGGNNTLTLQGPDWHLNGGIEIDTGSLTFNQTSDQTVGNVISGNGSVIQQGAGKLTLNGVNTYTGGTTVSAGTLAVGDAAHPSASIMGDVRVDGAGTLRGHGTVGGNVTNDGIVWPGGSIGTLTVDGDYTQSHSGTLRIDLSPSGASQLKVGGTANLAGALVLLYGPGTYTARSYPILTAAHVNGAFETVSGSAVPAGFASTFSYGPGGMGLNLLLGGPVVIAPTNATIFGDLGATLLRASQHGNQVLLDRLNSVCSSASEGGCARPGQRLWIQTEGTLTHVEDNRGAPDVRDQRYGFTVGTDRAFGPWTAGLAGSYSHGELWEAGDEASAKTDTARLALYGGRALGVLNLSGTASYAYHFTSTQRDFPGFGRTTGDGHGQEFAAALQASAPFALSSAITLAPHLGLRYAYVDGLSEEESGLASQRLNAQGQTLQSLQPYAGATLEYAFTPRNTDRQGHLQLRAGYAYETQSVGRDVAVVASDGTGFVIPGTRDSRNQVTAGLGLDLPLGKVTRIYARYDAVLPTGNVLAQSAQVGVNYRF